MDLPSPRELKLDAATRELLRDVEETARRVNELRPLEPAVVKSVLDGLLADRVYSSNAVEGNPLGLGETREILQAGYVETGKSRAEKEVVNLGKAIAYVADDLQFARILIKVDHLLRLHAVLMEGMEEKKPGRFRTVDVQIRGARHQPPDASRVADLLKEMMIRLRTETDVDPLVRATWAHWAIARVHPFMDGNGRAARLFQDMILFREHYTCAIIEPHLRNSYLDALAKADEGDFNELIRQTTWLVAKTFDRYRTAQQETSSLKEWASEIVGKANVESAEKRTLSYSRWSRKMEELRYAFSDCAAAINRAGGGISIQFQPYDLIPQATWENIRTGASLEPVTFFHMTFRRGGHESEFGFQFEQHTGEYLENDPTVGAPLRVGLFVYQFITRDTPFGSEDVFAPSHALEYFEFEQELIRRELDPQNVCEEHEFEIGVPGHMSPHSINPQSCERVSATAAAKEFIANVLLNEMP